MPQLCPILRLRLAADYDSGAASSFWSYYLYPCLVSGEQGDDCAVRCALCWYGGDGDGGDDGGDGGHVGIFLPRSSVAALLRLPFRPSLPRFRPPSAPRYAHAPVGSPEIPFS